MICDHTVVMICNHKLTEQLQLDSELTLENTKTLVTQNEAIHEKQAEQRSKLTQELLVEFVACKPRGRES